MTPKPGVTSIKIIRIQVFFLGLCQKYLPLLLGLCQFSDRTQQKEKRPEYLTWRKKFKPTVAETFSICVYDFLLVNAVAEALSKLCSWPKKQSGTQSLFYIDSKPSIIKFLSVLDQKRF